MSHTYTLDPLNTSRVQAINSFGKFAKLMEKSKSVLPPTMAANIDKAVAVYDDWNRKYAGRPYDTVVSR